MIRPSLAVRYDPEEGLGSEPGAAVRSQPASDGHTGAGWPGPAGAAGSDRRAPGAAIVYYDKL
eukprot:278449-Hanusia_phi.AAC.1